MNDTNGGNAGTTTTTAAVQGRRTLLLDPHEIVVDHGANGRFEPETTPVDDLIWSAKGMLTIGQIQPIEVVKAPDKNYHVQVGNRRVMAARKINDLKLGAGGQKFLIEAIEVLPGNAEAAFARNIAENYARQSLSPMDIAGQLHKWITVYHWDKKRCAEFYGSENKPISRAWVDAHLALLKLEPVNQRKVHHREMGWQAGRELSSLSADEQQVVLEVIGGSGERATVDNIVKRKRQLNRLDKPRARPKSEVIEACEMWAGSPSCPPKTKKFLDVFVEFMRGKHDVDEVSDFIWKLA